MQERLYQYLDLIAQSRSFASLRDSKEGQSNPLLLEIIETLLERVPGASFQRFRLGVEALAERASELQISTIHSLAASILLRHPLEAGLKPGVRFAKEDEDDVDTLGSQLIEYWWQSEAFGNPANRDALNQILELVPAGDLQRWLEEVCAKPWIVDSIQQLTAEPNAECGETALTISEDLIQGLEGVRAGNVEKAVSELKEIVSRIRAGDKAAWLDLANFLYARRNYLFIEPRRRPKSVLKALMELPEEKQHRLQNFQFSYNSCLRAVLTECESSWNAWVQLLARFRDWTFSAGMERVGIISFDQMIVMAVELLKGNEAIRRSEWMRLQAVLVDEFQDTDADQLELLAHLLRTPPGVDHDIQGFFVGDVKQSIYRFRGVDVFGVKEFCNNYESIVQALRPKEEYHLSTSFRSTSRITGFVNTFFAEEFSLVGEAERLVPFLKSENGLPRWMILNRVGGDENVDRVRQIAAEATAEAILNHFEECGQYRGTLVLARSNRDLDAILPVLSRAGIPVSATGARTFYRHHEVLDLLNLLFALHHPQDTLAIAAVMRSPLIGLSDDEIHQLLQRVPPGRLFLGQDNLPELSCASARERVLQIRELARQRKEKPPLEWLHLVRRFLPFSSCVDRSDREGRTIVRLNRILDTFEKELSQGSDPPLVWLLKQRGRAGAGDRWDQDFGEDISIHDEGVDAVRVMTIHKAKGLEGDFVIVYGWESLLEECEVGSNGTSQRVFSTRRADGTPLQALSLRWGPLRIVTENYLEAAELEKLHSTEEAQRLSYVATTRARNRLLLIDAGSGVNSEPFALKDRAGLPTVEVLQWERRGIELSVSATQEAEIDWEAFRRLWTERDRVDWSTRVDILKHPTDMSGSHFLGEGDLEVPSRAANALEVGRLVHTYLERRIGEDFDGVFLEELWRNSGSSDDTVVEEAGERLMGFFTGQLLDQGGCPFIDRVRKAKILGQEVPVFLNIEGQPWHGVIDLIMAEDEAVCAVDFKTGTRREPLPETYLLQQRVYSVAAGRLFPDRQVTFEFWWMG